MIGEKEEWILQQALDLGLQSFYMKFGLDKHVLGEQEFKKTTKVLFNKLENGNFKKYSNEGYISNDFEEGPLVMLFILVIVNQYVYIDFKRKLCTR